LFFNAFDAASVPERKNPMGLLAAFARVAKRLPGECHLVLKVNNADAVRGLTDELVSAASQLPVTLWLEHASRSEMEALLAVCDAYVSLHRSEALGLALIEAMYLGKPVIATGYGGVCDFFDASTGWVVAHRETRLERTLPPYPKGSLWAEPDVDSAAAAMLAVFAGGDEVTLRTRAAHRRVDALYAPQRVADRICAHLAPVLPE
jgi:glycosyltransferase involved in cell wall biosynthesis